MKVLKERCSKERCNKKEETNRPFSRVGPNWAFCSSFALLCAGWACSTREKKHPAALYSLPRFSLPPSLSVSLSLSAFFFPSGDHRARGAALASSSSGASPAEVELWKMADAAAAATPEWATKEPCLMGIDEAGRGPVLGPMVYGCMYCARSYNDTLATLKFADSKTLKEEQREELFESLNVNSSIGWEVDVICPKDLSAKMLKRSKVNLNEISHNSAMGLVRKVLDMGVLLAEVYIDTVGDPEKYRIKLTEKFPGIKFVVAKKADSLYPVVSGASIVAKVTRDRALRNWVFDETALNMHMKTGSGYPGDPDTKQWLEDHKHPVFGFPTLVRFSWGTCTPFFKDAVEVTWESDEIDEDATNNGRAKRQVKLSSLGFTGFKRKTEEIESSGKGRCKFFQARKLELVKKFQ